MNFESTPTVELHRHWEAGLSPEEIAMLAARNKVTRFTHLNGTVVEEVDPQDPESVETYMNAIASGFNKPEGMMNFLGAFRTVNSLLQTTEDISDVIFSQLQREQVAGSLHTELRGSPLSVTQRTGIPLLEVMHAVQSGIDRAWNELGMSATQIACFSREKGLTDPHDLFKYQAPAVIDAATQLHREERPIGLDIAGMGEVAFPPSLFNKVFAPAREAGVPITVHAGEQGKPPDFEQAPARIIREALDMGARRIGHGTSLIADPALLREVADRRIGIEACPTSNALLGFMPLSEHPLKSLLDAGLLVSAATDDPLFFGIASVRAMLVQSGHALGLTPGDVLTLTRNGIAMAFVSETRRTALTQQLNTSRVN